MNRTAILEFIRLSASLSFACGDHQGVSPAASTKRPDSSPPSANRRKPRPLFGCHGAEAKLRDEKTGVAQLLVFHGSASLHMLARAGPMAARAASALAGRGLMAAIGVTRFGTARDTRTGTQVTRLRQRAACLRQRYAQLTSGADDVGLPSAMQIEKHAAGSFPIVAGPRYQSCQSLHPQHPFA